MHTIAIITFNDGMTVEPTSDGVLAIEMLVRNGRSLADAVHHIAGGPRMFVTAEG